MAWVQWLSVASVGAALYGPQMLIGLCGAEAVSKTAVSAAQGFLGCVFSSPASLQCRLQHVLADHEHCAASSAAERAQENHMLSHKPQFIDPSIHRSTLSCRFALLRCSLDHSGMPIESTASCSLLQSKPPWASPHFLRACGCRWISYLGASAASVPVGSLCRTAEGTPPNLTMCHVATGPRKERLQI